MKRFYLLVLLPLLFVSSCHHKKHEIPGTVTSRDTTPPGEVKNLKIISLDTALKLTWENPSDTDLKGILIVRREDRYPSSSTSDGIKAYSGRITTSFTDVNLVNGRRYYYRVFTYDNSFNFSNGVTISGVPEHIINPTEIPDVKHPHILLDRSQFGFTVEWTKPAGSWRYKVQFSNNQGTWDFTTGGNSIHITGVPVTVFNQNSILILTCTPDYSRCNDGVKLSFNIPFVTTYPGNFIPNGSISEPQETAIIEKLGDGIIYTGGSNLKFIKIYPGVTTFTVTMPLNQEIPLHVEGLVDQISGSRVINLITMGQGDQINYLKLERCSYNVYGDSTTNISGIILDESSENYNCADMAITGKSTQVIFSRENKFYIQDIDHGSSIPRLLYSADTILVINYCRDFVDLNNSGKTVVEERDPGGKWSSINIIDLLNPAAEKTISTFLSDNPPDIDIATYTENGDTYHLILLSYTDSGKSSLILYYNNPATGDGWKSFDIGKYIYKFNDYPVSSSDLYIDPQSNIIYASAITSSQQQFFTVKNYVSVVLFTISSGNVNLNQSGINTEYTASTAFFNQTAIEMVSPDYIYLVSLPSFSFSFEIEKYQLTGGTLATPVGSTPVQTYSFFRGIDDKFMEGNNTIYSITSGYPSSKYTSSGQDFTVLYHESTPSVIYVNNNTDIYENGNQMYSGSSTISYLTGGDYASNLPIFTFTDTNAMRMGIKKDSNWIFTTLVNSSSGLCKTGFTSFYPIFTTDTFKNTMMTFFVRSNNNKLEAIRWENKLFNRCITFSYTVTSTVDHMAVISDSGIYYLTISQHSGSGSSSDPVFSDLLEIGSDGTLIQTIRIPDHATMAVPVINSYFAEGKLMVVYYNPALMELKGYIPDLDYTTPLMGINLGTSAHEIHPYLEYSEGNPFLELTDTYGMGIRIYP